VKRVVFHVGVHRAGSSTIQGILERRREELARRGTAALVREDLTRGRLIGRLLAMHRGALNGIPAVWPIRRLPGSGVVVSEENLLGTMPGHRSDGLYPGHARAIRGLRLLGRAFDVRVRWIVRRQDRFIESVYAFRVSRGATVDFHSFVARSGGHLRWLPVARALAASGLDVRIALFEELFDAGTEARVGELLEIEGSEAWREPLRRGNVGMRGPALNIVRFLNREAGLDARERRAAIAALRGAARRGRLPSARTAAAAFESAGVPRLAAFAPDALAFAEREPPPGFDEAGRRELLARYDEENRELLRLSIVRADRDRWAGP
jgi:hypothetical protein